MREVIITSIFKDLTRKTNFLRGALGSSSIIWLLAPGMTLKFYTIVVKELKLKVRQFWGLIHTCLETAGEKLAGSVFLAF